jgi:kynurenine 3-monooxygenase
MHTSSSPPHVILIGAGVSGSLLAVFLARRGFRVDIYERRPDMRVERLAASRSINLALTTRGIHALREAGLWEQVLPIVVPMRGRMMHALDGRTVFADYGQLDTEVIYAVSRADLTMTLMDCAERQPGVTIHFRQCCVDMDPDSGEVSLRDEESGVVSRVKADTVIGTDGSASGLREAMRRGLPHFSYARHNPEYGYKAMVLPAAVDGSYRLQAHALHVWPRHSFMLTAQPNIDATFSCTLFLPHEGEQSFAALSTPDAVRRFFHTEFPDFAPLMPDLAEQFLAHPTGDLATIRCLPWRHEGKAALLGDAAHAIVPFFGQGMNCSFEDCVCLDRCIEEHGMDWPVVFASYERLRKPNTDAVADLALENFVEMRDLVTDPRFLFMKRVEIELGKRYPERFIPKYSMITFHRIPYATVHARGMAQDVILQALCAGTERLDAIDWSAAERLIADALPPLDVAPTPAAQ